MSLDGVDEDTVSQIAGLCEVGPKDIQDVYESTPLQVASLAATSKATNDSGSDAHQYTMKLDSSTHLDRFCYALREVVNANATLRTSIVQCGRGLLQVVLGESHHPARCPDTDDEDEWLAMLRKERSHAMSLNCPVLRIALFGRRLVLTLHHVISDERTSMDIMADVREILHRRTPTPRTQSKDFASHCSTIDEDRAKTFWTEKFPAPVVVWPTVVPGHVSSATSVVEKEIVPHEHALSLIEAAWILTAEAYTQADSVLYSFVLSSRDGADETFHTTLEPTTANVPVQAMIPALATVRELLYDRFRARRKLRNHAVDDDLIAVISIYQPQILAPEALRLLPEDEQEAGLVSIIEMAEQQLPSYMVPSTWVVVENMPRSMAQKLDRKRPVKEWLDEPSLKTAKKRTQAQTETQRAQSERQSAATLPMELMLRSIWSTVLDVPETSIFRETSFVKLGGDSVLAMQVSARCRQKGFLIKVVSLLRCRSLATAALECESQGGTRVDSSLENELALPHDGDRGLRYDPISEQVDLDAIGFATEDVQYVALCSPLQEDIVLHKTRAGTADRAWNRIVLELTPKIGGDVIHIVKLAQSWEAVCAAHDILRTVFASGVDGALRQVILKQNNPRILLLPASKFHRIRDYEMGVAAADQPPHCVVFARAVGVVRVRLDISHALADPSTIRRLFEQLLSGYKDLAAIVPGASMSQFPAQTLSSHATALQYWTRRLQGSRPCLLSSAVELKPGSEEHSRQRCRVPLDRPDRLSALCRQHEVTTASIMQVAWALVLHVCTSLSEPVFGCIVDEREWLDDDASTVLGPMLGMSICQVEFPRNTSIADVLSTVCEDSATGLEHTSFSLSELQDALELQACPLFNTALSFERKLPEDEDWGADMDIGVKPLASDDNSEYAIMVKAGYSHETFEVWLDYDTSKISDLYASATAATFARVIEKILEDRTMSAEEILETIVERTAEPDKYAANIDDHQTLDFLLKGLKQCDQTATFPAESEAAVDVTGAAATLSAPTAGLTCILEADQDKIECIVPATFLQTLMLGVQPDGSFALSGSADTFVLDLSPALDVHRLAKALQDVVEHHAVLRTALVRDGSTAYQVVLKSETLADVADSALSTMLPSFRLIRDDLQCYAVHLSIHHAFYDDISLKLVLSDLKAAYDREPLGDGPRFDDWAAYKSQIDTSESELFWRKTLADSNTMTSLAGPQRGLAKDAGMPGKRCNRITARLARLKAYPGTVSTVLKAAWAMVLFRARGGAHDVVFAEVAADRNPNVSGVEKVRGPCMNLLPVKVRVHRDSDMSSLVSELQEQADEALPHHHINLSSVVGKVEYGLGSVIAFQEHSYTDMSIGIGGSEVRLSGESQLGGGLAEVWIVAWCEDGWLVVELNCSDRVPKDTARELKLLLELALALG